MAKKKSKKTFNVVGKKLRQAYFDATPKLLLSFMKFISNLPEDARLIGVETVSNPYWEQVADKKLVKNIRFYFSTNSKEVPERHEGQTLHRFEVEIKEEKNAIKITKNR